MSRTFDEYLIEKLRDPGETKDHLATEICRTCVEQNIFTFLPTYLKPCCIWRALRDSNS